MNILNFNFDLLVRLFYSEVSEVLLTQKLCKQLTEELSRNSWGITKVCSRLVDLKYKDVVLNPETTKYTVFQ